MRRHIVPWSCAAGAALVAACSGSGAHPTTLPVAHTTAPTALTAASTTTSGVVTSTSTATSTTVVTPVAGGAHLSADGPWTLVASAPGITTPGLVYQLMPKLWVYLPTKEDIPHGIIWTLRAPDVPIIEAYLHARLVYFQAITSHPIDVSSPDWEKWYVDGGAAIQLPLNQAISENWTADLDLGVVLRPQIVGDGRDSKNAIIFDCVLDGGVFITSSGALASGSSRGVSPQPFGFKMGQSAGRWFVTQVGRQAEACAG